MGYVLMLWSFLFVQGILFMLSRTLSRKGKGAVSCDSVITKFYCTCLTLLSVTGVR
jgi:hypothetical protein